MRKAVSRSASCRGTLRVQLHLVPPSRPVANYSAIPVKRPVARFQQQSPFNAHQTSTSRFQTTPCKVHTNVTATPSTRHFSTNQNMEARNKQAVEEVNELIASNKVVIFGRTGCGYCVRAKKLFDSLGVPYKYLEVDTLDNGEYLREALIQKTNRRTFPNIFVNGVNTGGCDDTTALHSKGELVPLLQKAGLAPKI